LFFCHFEVGNAAKLVIVILIEQKRGQVNSFMLLYSSGRKQAARNNFVKLRGFAFTGIAISDFYAKIRGNITKLMKAYICISCRNLRGTLASAAYLSSEKCIAR